MGRMRRGFWVCFILILVFVNSLSAEPVKAKKTPGKKAMPMREVSEEAEIPQAVAPKLENTTPKTPSRPAAQPSSVVKTNSSSTFTQPRPVARKRRTSIRWNLFQVGGGAMFDSDGGNAGALSLTWNPTYLLASSLSLKGYMGGLMSNLFAGNGFGIGDLGLTAKYYLSETISFEAGGGIQYWTGTRHKNLFPQIKAGIGFERFVITYSSAIDSLLTTHQVLGAVYIEL